jgi:hypothetical protein
MHWLRTSPMLARLVLAWFVSALGVAGAAPVVHPKAMEVVCSAAGMVEVVVADDGQSTETNRHTLDCPACLPATGPLPAASVHVQAPAPLAHAWLPGVAAHGMPLAGAPLPARGPPSFV